MSDSTVQASPAVSTLPKPYIVAAALSALAFVVTTVALSAIPHVYPQVGLIGFSVLGGSAALSFIAVILSLCLLNRKRDKLLGVKEQPASEPPPVPVAAPPPPVAAPVAVVEAPPPASPAAAPVDKMTLFREALPHLFSELDHLCSALVQANDKAEGRSARQAITYATEGLSTALNAILDDPEQMSRLTFALIVTTSFKLDAFTASVNDPQAFLQNLSTYCNHDVIQALQGQIALSQREQSTFNRKYQVLRAKAAKIQQAKETFEANGSLQNQRALNQAYEAFENAQVLLFEWLLARESVDTNTMDAQINQNTSLALQGICAQLHQMLLGGLVRLKGQYQSGFFDQRDVQAFFYTATSLKGMAIRVRVKQMIRLMPLKRKYQDRILAGFAEPIVELLATPIYNASVNSTHLLRSAIQGQLIGQADFAAVPQLPDETPVDQQIIFFANTLQQFATQIDDLNFTAD
ncbi:MAG: hypothetical protein S4CHLAM2_10010 [Chlamydiales bacterium]|nr:hypothetical protein [Chlamydiales bacterium]